MISDSEKNGLKKKDYDEQLKHPVFKRKGNPHLTGWITIFLIFGIFGVWAMLAQIDTNVQAGGKVISKGYKKTVIHPRGGMITKLYVHEGQNVKKGMKLIELDNADIKAQLKNSIEKHDKDILEKARLEAEIKFLDRPDFLKYKAQLIDQNKSREFAKNVENLFNSEMNKFKKTINLYQSKISVLIQQNQGFKQKIESDKKLLESYKNELKKWQRLYDKNMTDELTLLDRKRKIEQIQSEINDYQSKIEENKKNIDSYEKQISLQKASFIDDANNQLSKINDEILSLKNSIDSLKNSLNRTIIKAPDSGTVTQLTVHSVGEAVLSQRPIMYIVPNKGKIVLELHVSPNDIDRIHLGQKADIHFPSYVDPSALPIYGKVTYISADTVQSEGSSTPYYRVLVEITKDGMEAIKKNGYVIVPGMPVSVYIKSGHRSFMSYILLPLESLIKGAFRAN